MQGRQRGQQMITHNYSPILGGFLFLADFLMTMVVDAALVAASLAVAAAGVFCDILLDNTLKLFVK